jgi:ABC-type Fe3+/spermidine/putrescine transport system ATPase subunit
MEMIDRMGLSEHIDKKPVLLSGGQQQRVAIARTLVMNPDIILFDEPMSALDVATRLSLRKTLKQIQEDFGTTMIYITHDQEEAFAMSDRIMIMREANIVQIGTPKEIVQNPADNYVKEFVIDNVQTKIDSLIHFMRE